MSPLKAPTNVKIPQPREVAELLSMLFGLDVDVRPGTKEPALRKGAVASYVAPDGPVHALIHLDLALAGSAGAALTRIPTSVVQETVRAGKLAANLLENLCEVTNVLCRLTTTHTAHLRVQTTVALPATNLPPAVERTLAQGKPVALYEITVSGYPPGGLALLEVVPDPAAASGGGKP